MDGMIALPHPLVARFFRWSVPPFLGKPPSGRDLGTLISRIRVLSEK
jgi:hypothetical protein